MRRFTLPFACIVLGLALGANVGAQPSDPGTGPVPAPPVGGAQETGRDTGPALSASPGPPPPLAISPAALTPNGGVEGLVNRAPLCPGPERPGQVCELPFQATLQVKNAAGALVSHFQSDAYGRFFVMLPPGWYTIEALAADAAAGAPGGERPAASTFEVTPGNVTSVRIEIDTGIR